MLRGYKEGTRKQEEQEANILMYACSFEDGEIQRSRCLGCPGVCVCVRLHRFEKQHRPLEIAAKSFSYTRFAVCMIKLIQ